MREIKFRAWDKTQVVMIENVKIDEIGHACWYSGSVCQVSPFVMQFTGLKDKNGKEIYEGDIMAYENTPLIYDATTAYPRYVVRYGK
jgi:YopX protein.